MRQAVLHGLPRGGPRPWRAGERELTRGLELVTVLADRDQPVRAGRRQIRVTAVAGIGEHDADRVVGSTGYLVQVPCGGLGGAHHGGERGHVVRGLTDLDRGDDLVTGYGHLGVVALQETSSGRHQPGGWVGNVRDGPRQLLGP